MKLKRLKILGFVYWGAALCSFLICIFDVIVGGLFADAYDIKGGIGVAMLCVVLELLLAGGQGLLGRKLLQRDFKFALQKGLLLAGAGLFTLIFNLVGGYIVIPALVSIILPAVGLFLAK